MTRDYRFLGQDHDLTSCPRPTQIELDAAIMGSVIPGATIFLKTTTWLY